MTSKFYLWDRALSLQFSLYPFTPKWRHSPRALAPSTPLHAVPLTQPLHLLQLHLRGGGGEPVFTSFLT